MNNEQIHNKEINDLSVLTEWLELLDKYLAMSNVKIADRPFNASILLVEKKIISIDGDLSDNFATENWFKEILRYAYSWYSNKYGDIKKDRALLVGVMIIYNTPYAINIPVTIHRKSQEHKGCLEVCFPRTAYEIENVLDMVVCPPNFHEMNKQHFMSILRRIKSIITVLRNVNIDIMLANVPEKYYNMRSSVIQHLNSVAEKFVSNEHGASCFMYWDLQLAIEKSFKIYLLQRDGFFPQIHDLRKLYKTAGGKKELDFSEKLFCFIPDSKTIIDYRYNGSSVSNVEFMLCYKAGLAIIKRISRKMKRRLEMNDGACFIVNDMRC